MGPEKGDFAEKRLIRSTKYETNPEEIICCELSVLGIMTGDEKAVDTFAEYVRELHEVCVAKIESFV
ncbi:MAG: hypothetical protein ACYTBV_18190 [Planctomycetota bacterium]